MFEKFQEQIDFIEKAVKFYDKGDWQSIKIASAPMRTLFYAQRSSKPLIEMIDSFTPEMVSSTRITKEAFLYDGPVTPVLFHNTFNKQIEPVYLPLLGMDEIRVIPFENWINGRLLFDKNEEFTRHDLIKFIANKDGGAHVDQKIEEKYYNLSHNLHQPALSINTAGNVTYTYKNLHLALLRQMAHEALASFGRQKLLPSPYRASNTEKYFKKHMKQRVILAGGISMNNGDCVDEVVYF